MTELLTAAQMRAIEAAAIASGEVTGLELMERAGRGVVEAILAEWPELAKGDRRAVVLCGPGNNGGDGFVVARLLKEAGWGVEVFLYGEAGKLPPDARANYERWVGMGEVIGLPMDGSHHDPWDSDLIVDALFGTGLTRPLAFPLSNMLPEWDLRETAGRPRIVAVDVPAGLCADSGRFLADSDGFWADLTITFHTEKPGHRLAAGPFQCGRVVKFDIGLPSTTAKLSGSSPWVLYPPNVAVPAGDKLALVEQPYGLGKGDPFGRERHKFSHGHALILSGPPGHCGAARLSARAALRVGAGLVTLACPPEAVPENAARLDAIMLRPVGDAGALAEVLRDKRITALCIGPGLGLDGRARDLLAAVLGPAAPPPPPSPPHRGEGGRDIQAAATIETGALPLPPVGSGQGWGELRLVLDADALTLLSQNPDLFARLHKNCVLTPHGGEFARLFPDIAAKLDAPATTGPAYSKVDATREAAARAGCIVLFKGPDTVIADPTGRCSINSAHYDRAAPWLATAGSGDVLAGFITGLMARGFLPMQAAETAAWLHVECARSFGPGLIAEDLPEELPKVFRALGL